MTPEQVAQRNKEIDAAYAGIFIPPLAQEDMRASAFYTRTTLERDATGRVDAIATARNEGARAFLVSLEQRIARAWSTAEAPTKAVSATAETT